MQITRYFMCCDSIAAAVAAAHNAQIAEERIEFDRTLHEYAVN